MESKYIFVYGTLKRGQESPLKQQMALKTIYLEDVEICADLYMVSYYPGLVLGSPNKVYGELFKITDHSIIDQLDEYEGCSSHSSQPHEYQRSLIPIKCNFGNIQA